MQGKGKNYLKNNLTSKNKEILREVLKRYYGCRIILGHSVLEDYPSSPSRQMDFEPHANVLPALCIVRVTEVLVFINVMITHTVFFFFF